MNVKNRTCIRRLSFRSLWASRKRNLIAIIAIILTTLLFTSLFTVVMSMSATYEMYTFRQIGGYSHGTFKNVTKEQMNAIAAHDKVKEVGARKLVGMTAEGVFSKTPAEISFMDENCTKWSYALPSKGHMPRAGKEITMDTGALELLGIKPEQGAKITLTFTVGNGNDLFFEKTDTFILTGWWEYDEISPVHYINISEEYAKLVEEEVSKTERAGAEPFPIDLNVMMASSVDIRGQMEQVDLDLGYTWETRDEENSVRIGVNWGYMTSKLDAGFDMTTVVAIAAFLILVIFTGYLIIYNIFQISVTGDIRFYGLLKTIGVTPRQLRRMIRQQALLLCIVGIPVGLLLGYGVGAVLTPVIIERTSFHSSVANISASPFIFIASALFALITVLLSCTHPGKLASRVSPVEATKYTEVLRSKKKRRATRGAKVYQMAFANLGRNKSKTVLVVISLSLSVVLLNVLSGFVGGFDMEKYLENKICADFIVSGMDYFRNEPGAGEYIPDTVISAVKANTTQTVSGSGYTLPGTSPKAWMTEENWRKGIGRYYSEEMAEQRLNWLEHRGNLVSESILLEGLDETLFDKLEVVEGSLDGIFEKDSRSIVLVALEDDYGNVSIPEFYPKLGETLPITYIDEGWYIDSRTGKEADENTPNEYMEFHVEKGHDVEYTVDAYVTLPNSMSHRYSFLGYEAILPADRMEQESGQTLIPLFYLFDTPDAATEAEAEQYLAEMTDGNQTEMMYESKATARKDFESFRNMFLMLGGLLCAIIGLVGVLNFFNAIMTGILSRRREFAVLQSVGMTNRQLKAMLVYEGLFYALGASAVALVLSIVISPLVGNVLEGMFWFYSAKFTVSAVLIVTPVFAFMGWLIPTVIYGQVARNSIVERLRETE